MNLISALKTNKTMQSILVLTVICLILIAGIVLSAQKTPVLALQKQTSEQELQLSNVRLAHMQNLAANEEQTRAEYASLQQALPMGISQDEVFNSVHVLSQKYGVDSVNQVTFLPTIGIGDVFCAPITIIASGDYIRVMAMLEEYTNSSRLVNIQRFSIQQDTTTPTDVRVEAEINVYFQQ